MRRLLVLNKLFYFICKRRFERSYSLPLGTVTEKPVPWISYSWTF